MADLARFLSRPVVEVAPDLLGAEVCSAGVRIRLTEVEAYAGTADPGSHAFRRTARSAIMYGPPGFLYCYFVYGMHVCANVVTGREGEPGAVLLRGGEVIAGLDLARRRRPGVADHQLARGPALLCRTLGLDLSSNGVHLESGPVRLVLRRTPPEPIRAGPRVGLRRGAEEPWRFWLEGDPTVSRYRPASSRRAGGESP